MLLIYLTLCYLQIIRLFLVPIEITKLLYEQTNNELDKLRNWLSLNKLSMNIGKTNNKLYSNEKKNETMNLY